MSDFPNCERFGLRVQRHPNHQYPTVLAKDVEEILKRKRYKGIGRKHGLTPRQWDFVEQIYYGKSDKEIADILCVSVDAIRAQVNLINKRWQTKGKLDIIKRVIELKANGLTLPVSFSDPQPAKPR